MWSLSLTDAASEAPGLSLPSDCYSASVAGACASQVMQQQATVPLGKSLGIPVVCWGGCEVQLSYFSFGNTCIQVPCSHVCCETRVLVPEACRSAKQNRRALLCVCVLILQTQLIPSLWATGEQVFMAWSLWQHLAVGFKRAKRHLQFLQ